MQRGENRLWPRCDQTLDEESRVLLSSELDGLKAKYYERTCVQSVEDDYGYTRPRHGFRLATFYATPKTSHYGVLGLHALATNLD